MPRLQDTHGDQLTKEELREEMQSAKRLYDVDPNLELKPELITKFHKVRIHSKTSQSWNWIFNSEFKSFYFQTIMGGRVWTVKVHKKMRENYFLSRDQYFKMEAPTLRGTKLNMAVRELNFSTISKTLLGHQCFDP